MKILLKLQDAIVKKCGQNEKTSHKDIFNNCVIMKSEKECNKIDFFDHKNDK